MKTLVAVLFGVAMLVGTAASADEYGRCRDRAVKSCNAFEEGSQQSDRPGQGSTATHEAED